jgi:hypothetical protein
MQSTSLEHLFGRERGTIRVCGQAEVPDELAQAFNVDSLRRFVEHEYCWFAMLVGQVANSALDRADVLGSDGSLA